MKLCIFGSRTITSNSAKAVVKKYINKQKPNIIITAGDAKGICKLAQMVAHEMNIILQLYFLDKKKNAGMYHHRSISCLTHADQVLFIHDGTSQGTLNEVALAKKMCKKFTYVKMTLSGTTEIFNI